jgi:hypothetical protein
MSILFFQFKERLGDKWVSNRALLPVLTSNVLHSCYQAKGQDSAKGKDLEPYNKTTYSNFTTGSHGAVGSKTIL